MNSKLKKSTLENKHNSNDKFALPHESFSKISACQLRIWKLKMEINALGALFRNMQTCDMNADEYYGISLCLMRTGQHLGKIQAELEKMSQKSP